MAVSDLNAPSVPETSRSVAADVYVFGALLHVLLTGYQPAFSAAPLPPAAQFNPALPLGLSETLATATDSDPERRFATMRAFHQRLGAFQQIGAAYDNGSLDSFSGISRIADPPTAAMRDLNAPQANWRVKPT